MRRSRPYPIRDRAETPGKEVEVKGQGRGRGQRMGQGGGGRGGQGGRDGGGRDQGGGAMGAGGSCLCPKCGRRFPHQQGIPCLKERCQDCGVALIREGSVHHQEITRRHDDAARKGTEG